MWNEILKRLWILTVIAAMIMPVTAQAIDFPVTSPFGWRIHPISGQWKFHAGVDLGYEYGSYIGSLFDGQVITAGNLDDGYGNQVLIYQRTA